MKKNINVAIIGCGRVSGHHCRSIEEIKGIELVAVCDLIIEKANNYQEQFGAKAYNNYHQMLQENPQIDTVAVITPSGMHYEHTLDIITRYQKNIIVEKPTFLKQSHVHDVYETAKKNGVQVFAVFQNRHNLAVKRVEQGLSSGELGQIRCVSIRVRWCRPQLYYDMAPWRGTYSMDGGCLTNQGIHHIDLLRRLGGEVRRVCCLQKTLGADIEVEDTANATIEFQSGIAGSLEITTAARPLDFEASLSLVCEKGLAQIGGIAVNELQVYSPDPDACKNHSEDFSGNVYGHGHVKIYEEIFETLNERAKYSVTFDDALATIQLLNAFYLSDENQNWVDVSSSSESIRLGKLDNELANLYRSHPQIN